MTPTERLAADVAHDEREQAYCDRWTSILTEVYSPEQVIELGALLPEQRVA